MPDDDDQHWLGALAGRPAVSAADAATLREGAIVRQAMLDAQRSLPRVDAEAAVRRLLARLREEKLLENPGLGRFGWKVPALGVAVALVIAFGLALYQRPPKTKKPAAPEIPVMKGDPAAAQELVTAEARAIADEIREMMTKAQLAPTVTERGSATLLEAEWPRNPTQAQLNFLRFYGFELPNGPKLRIDVRPRPGE